MCCWRHNINSRRLTRRGEEVKDYAIFQCLGSVGDMTGKVQHFARPRNEFATIGADLELQSPRNHA